MNLLSPNKAPALPLGSSLRRVEAATARLRSCARAAQVKGWVYAPTGHYRMTVKVVEPSVLTDACVMLELRSGAAGIVLAISLADWPALASAVQVADEGQRSALAGLLIGARLGPWSFQWECVSVMPGGVDLGPDPGVVVMAGGLAARVVAADAAVLDLFESEVRRIPAAARSAGTGLRILGRLVLQVRPLSRDVLGSLDEGDVVLLPSGDADDGSHGVRAVMLFGRRGGVLRIEGFVEGKRMTVIPQAGPEEGLHDLARPDPDGLVSGPGSDGGRLVPVGHLELAVTVEIDGPAMTVDEVAALGEGDVVELPVPLDRARARLVVEGQAIAVGELVSVGQMLGFRTLRMVRRP